MIDGKNILAIVPARMGSKRLKMKNIKIFKGKPLFIWALKSAMASKYIDDIFLTTDSKKVQKIAKQHGYYSKYLRNPKLSKDKTSANEVIIDVLKNLKKNTTILFIYKQPHPYEKFTILIFV